MLKTITLDQAELLNNLMTNSENVLRAVAPRQGNEPHMTTHSAALENINHNNTSIILRLWHLMHHPLQEGTWASWIVPVPAHNTQYHHLSLLNHSLPQHRKATNRLQIRIIHQAHLVHHNTVQLNHLHTTAVIPMIDNFLNRHIQPTLPVSSMSISKSSGEHLLLINLPLQQVPSIHPLTRTIVLLITHTVLDLKALLPPLFHH
jgi:hypothetical protein